MILGYQLTYSAVIVVGLLTMLLLVFQMLVGMRKIKFKGRTHMKVHRWAAWALVGLGVVHGIMALTVYYGWTILS